jgi:hypothetical protein
MTPEQRIGAFDAWLQDRDQEQARRLRFCRSEHRRLLLKTEAAELDAIRAEFSRLVLEERVAA